MEKSSETANLGQSSKEQDGQGNVANKAVEEPELIEKAKTFGVIEVVVFFCCCLFEMCLLLWKGRRAVF